MAWLDFLRGKGSATATVVPTLSLESALKEFKERIAPLEQDIESVAKSMAKYGPGNEQEVIQTLERCENGVVALKPALDKIEPKAANTPNLDHAFYGAVSNIRAKIPEASDGILRALEFLKGLGSTVKRLSDAQNYAAAMAGQSTKDVASAAAAVATVQGELEGSLGFVMPSVAKAQFAIGNIAEEASVALAIAKRK